MSLLEGHGDVTMDRAGADRIPNADRFSRVLRERRQQRGPAKVLTSLIGLDAKLRQYEQGERFIAAVEEAGGPELLARVWGGPRVAAELGGDPRTANVDRPHGPSLPGARDIAPHESPRAGDHNLVET